MSDSSWSKPDESDRASGPGGPDDPPNDAPPNNAPSAEPPSAESPSAESPSEVRGSLGPRSSSLPNVPDITPVAGTPMPRPGDVAPEGTAVMPVVPVAPPTTATTPTPPMPSGPGIGAVGGQRYVVADRVPWYRTPDGRARAGVAGGLALLVVVVGIIWLVTRGSDDGDVLVTDESTTTFVGQFGADLDATTTTLLVAVPAESLTTELVETTIESTTTVPETTTTTTVPETSTTIESTTTVPETTTTTTTTTTLPPPPEVVVPGSKSTIGEIIQASPGLTELDRVIASVGFYAELNALTDPYTLFAPSNDAIREIAATLPADPEAVRALLRRHVTIDGRLGSRELLQRTELKMLDGSTVTVDAATQTVGGAMILVADKGGADTDQLLYVIAKVIVG